MKTIIQNSKKWFWVVLLTTLACDIADNEINPEDNFFRIYDSFDFGASFMPLDVKATPDSGFLILGARRLTESNFTGVYVMKINAQGIFESEGRMDPQWVQPANSLLQIDDEFYFFCMNATSLRSHIVKVETNGEIGNPIQLSQELYYPMNASADGDQLILMGYDNLTKNSVLSRVNTNGTVAQSRTYSIGPGDGVEAPIIRHFTRTGKRLPFFTGSLPGGLHYFNGFYNYTMSLVIVNFGNPDPVGVVQGQQENGGISALKPLTGNNYAISRFNFGDNFLIPATPLNTSGVSSSVDLQGNAVPELIPDSPIVIKTVEIDNIEYVVFGGNTRNGQIILLAYESDSGNLAGSKYLGFSNTFEIAGMEPLADGGLAVVGSTYSAGRFARTSLVKLSSNDLSEIIKIKSF